jgi:hypothetical protein
VGVTWDSGWCGERGEREEGPAFHDCRKANGKAGEGKEISGVRSQGAVEEGDRRSEGCSCDCRPVASHRFSRQDLGSRL